MDKNNNTIRDYVEMNGERKVMMNYINSSSDLISLLSKIESLEYKNNQKEYKILYEQICEKISDIDINVDMLKFIFNTDTIERHTINKMYKIQQEVSLETLKTTSE